MTSNPILRSISNWFSRTFADPTAVTLVLTLVFALLLLEFFSGLFMPILISIVIAYLLNSLVRLLEGWKVPHLVAVIIIFCIFLGLLIFALLILIPSFTKQLANLVNELPQAFSESQTWIKELMARYPKIFTTVQVQHVTTYLQSEVTKLGPSVLRISLGVIPNVIQVVLYFILVPLLVFFFLKDSGVILNWSKQYLPKNEGVGKQVWLEVREKIGAYVKGRVLEIIIVGVVSSIVFALLGLQYAVLLGALVGLSVIIPYIGAIVVTIPVVIVSLMQWGFSAHFLYLMIAYATIIALDANLLVPILFSETMDLHPIVIILSVLIFGGLWGFWGVFFAIPLATLFNAILRAWPKSNPQESLTSSSD